MNNTTIPGEAGVLPNQLERAGVWTIRQSSTTYLLPCILLLALCLAGAGRAALVNEWNGDNYTSSNNWVDTISSVAMVTNSGSPLAVASVFNTHAGVTMNGGFFTVPTNTATAGLSNFTVVVVFKPTALGSFTPNYFNAIPLFAFDIGGGGQIDFGMSYGNPAGQGVDIGVGTQTASGGIGVDQLQQTPNLALNTVHAVALQVNGANTNVVTYADGVAVASNNVVNVLPRSLVNLIFVGGGQFVGNTRFPGQIAAIQVYNDATTNCAILTANLVTKYATPAPITLNNSTGADPGSNAPVTITIPASASASGSFAVTLASDNTSVVANKTVTFAQGQTSTNTTFPILAVGIANVTASGTGVGSATMAVAGLDESGLANQWLADTFVTLTGSWTDSKGGVTATGTGNEIAVTGAFGPAHNGVARNALGTTTGADGFTIPAGTAPGGLTNYTIAVVFKPSAPGPNNGNYYGSQIMFGFDIGGGGQADYGMSWGGGDPNHGQRIVVGIGRSGGDSQIQSAGGLPLALNTTHVAVLQVNAGNGGANGTQTLFVDGIQMGQNGGLNMNIASSQAIPLLNQSIANIGNAFPGLVAEVRVYNSATVNGGGLSTWLQSQYAALSPITLSFPGLSYVDTGSNIVLTVGVPASATSGGPFTVTLTSSDPTVAASTSVTLLQGRTSTNVTFTILGLGPTTVTASGSGVGSATIVFGGLSPRTLVDALRASSLPAQGAINGQPISSWTGDSNIVTALQVLNVPTFKATATIAGTPSAVFDKTQQQWLDVPPGNDPFAGLTNFSIVAVYKATAVGVGGVGDGAWYGCAGIVDHEIGGVQFDWGLELDSGGFFEWGTGSPDHEVTATNYSAVSPLFHVVIGTYDTLNGLSTVTLDDQPTIINSNLLSSPRIASDTRIGKNSGTSYTSGEIAEVDFYNGALSASERAALASALKSKYGLIWPDQSLIFISANPASGQVPTASQLTLTIPAGANNSSSVTVNVSSGTPSVATVGGLTSTNVVFAAGSGNVQTLPAQIIGIGSSVVTAAATGLISNTVTLFGLAAPTNIETFHAYSLTNQSLNDGDAVGQWLGDILMTPANAGAAAPTFHTNATPAGGPSVVLNAANTTSLVIPTVNDPFAGLTEISIVAVFKDYSAATGDNGQFYTEAGIADHEMGGVTYDWGLEINGAGQFAWGTGSPDTTIASPLVVLNDGKFHVVVGTYDALGGVSTIYVDNQAPISVSGIASAARLASDTTIGTGHPGSYLSGELAELDFYNGAMTSTQAATLIGGLQTTYNLVIPSYKLLITNSGNKVQIAWPTAATTAGYVLQSTTNLPGGWSASGLSFLPSGANNVATDSVTNKATYYRLSHP